MIKKRYARGFFLSLAGVLPGLLYSFLHYIELVRNSFGSTRGSPCGPSSHSTTPPLASLLQYCRHHCALTLCLVDFEVDYNPYQEEKQSYCPV